MNQTIFNSFPIVETTDLILRKVEPEHAKDLFDFLSDDSVNRYMTNNSYENLVQVQRLINGSQQSFEYKQKIHWGIAKKEVNKIIGLCGYLGFDTTNLVGEISYCLTRQLWGQGIMTQAIDGVIGFGFKKLGLNRIEAKTMIENTGSCKVLEKNGFTKEGLLREYLLKNGVFHDLYGYAILKRDYILL